MLRALIATAALWVSAVFPATAQQLTAEHFTRVPNIWSAAISPDGNYVAAIQSVAQGDQLVIIDWRTRQAQALQLARRDQNLSLDWVSWKDDNRLLFVVRLRAVLEAADRTGTRMGGRPTDDVDFDITRVFAVNRDGTNLTQMFEGQTRRFVVDFAPVSLIDELRNDPEHVMLGTYGRRGYSLFRANVNNGRTQELATGSWDTGTFYVDGNGEPVMRLDWLSGNSGYQIFRRGPGQRRWELAHEFRRSSVAQGREFNVLGPGPGAGQMFVAARPAGHEYQAIYIYDTNTGELGAPVHAHQNADAGSGGFNTQDNQLIVACAELQRLECRATDPTMQRHFDALNTYFENSAVFALLGTSRNNQWLLAVDGPTLTPTYYVYDVANTSVTPVASAYPQISRSALSATDVVEYTGRDGTPLWGYLTRPVNAGSPAPLVVMPHGGPEARDSYGFDPLVQFLATRGYAVFQPNFRGSEGSGRSFAEAGYQQWGRAMQDDITDGVRHLIDTGAADAQRVCIVGISYGGYAALAGASLTPDLYQCAVSIAGVSDLIDFLDSTRQESGRTSTTYAYWRRVIGDANADQATLAAVSPRRLANNITAPVLLMHGTQDDIVLVRESEGMRDALQRAGKNVRYVAFQGVGHPWHDWEEQQVQRVFEEVERFLAPHLSR